MYQETKKPHKHAESIKAWADGAEIEVWVSSKNEWQHVANQYLSWREDCKYRIKPPPESYGKLAEIGYAKACFQKEAWSIFADYVLSEFCKRNSLNRSEMK